MKTIALCLNLPELMNNGQWMNKEACNKYPGSGWLPVLAKMALDTPTHLEIFDGETVIKDIKSGRTDPKDVFVVQEEFNSFGLKLIELGANPSVIFCLEAPLFTPFFYDAIFHDDERIMQFQKRLFFGEMGTEPVHFPSYDIRDIKEPIPFEGRKPVVMVVSNKHYSAYENMFGHSPSWQRAIVSQLHDLRYEIIHSMQKDIDLFGKGWPSEIGSEIPPGEKVNVIKNYQVSFCYENMVMNGYVTEKIIDCMVAGVVPLYAGAPDITKYVPKECFVGRHVSDLEDLDIQKCINAGQEFLKSELGHKFSYQGWAGMILSLIE